MGSKEAITYLETAEEQLRDAELVFKGGSYALCVFLSASAAENATSALITKLGLAPSKKHRNSLILKMILDESDKTQPSMREIIESLKSLEPHITRARYPIRRGVQLLPPSKLYLRKDAEFALSSARRVLLLVKNLEKS